MIHALWSRHGQNAAAAAAVMVRMVACLLCVGSLVGLQACAGNNPRSGQSDTRVTMHHGGTAQFPSNAHLRCTTVSLRMAGFMFGAGLMRDHQGNPTGNGVERVPRPWCGSGFVIGQDGTIVTNYHVAQSPQGASHL